MQPKVSVIIPLYNKESSIEHTLTSVSNQSFKDYEVIIINDGSTDNSLTITETYATDRVSIYTTKNKGVSHARNYGVSKSNAELIAFLDADDIWLPNHLEELYNLYQSHPNCGLYACNYTKVFFDKVSIKTMFNTIPNNFYGIIEDYFKASIIDSIAWTSAVAVPKSVFLAQKGFNVELKSVQDTDLWIRLALNYSVAFSSKITTKKNINNLDNHLSLQMDSTEGILLTSQFTSLEKTNKSLKKYIDLNRFSFSIERKMNNDHNSYKKLKSNLNTRNLNYKQQFILSLPAFILRQLVRLKYYLIKRQLYISPFK